VVICDADIAKTKIEQNEPHQKRGVNSRVPEGWRVRHSPYSTRETHLSHVFISNPCHRAYIRQRQNKVKWP